MYVHALHRCRGRIATLARPEQWLRLRWETEISEYTPLSMHHLIDVYLDVLLRLRINRHIFISHI